MSKQHPQSVDEVRQRLREERLGVRQHVLQRIASIDGVMLENYSAPSHHARCAAREDLLEWVDHLTSNYKSSLALFRNGGAVGDTFDRALSFVGQLDMRMLPAIARELVDPVIKKHRWGHYTELIGIWTRMLCDAPLGASYTELNRDDHVRQHAPAILRSFCNLASAIGSTDIAVRVYGTALCDDVHYKGMMDQLDSVIPNGAVNYSIGLSAEIIWPSTEDRKILRLNPQLWEPEL